MILFAPERITVYKDEGIFAEVKNFIFDNRDGSVDEKYFVVFWQTGE